LSWLRRGLAQARLGRLLPIAVFAVVSAVSFAYLAGYRHAPAIVLVWPAFVVVAMRWPAVGMIGASIVLRLGYVDVCCTDQIAVSNAAWERVSHGLGGPYGVGYAETVPPGAPFPYGPLGLVWWLAGPITEFGAALGIMVVLVWQRAFVTLAMFAAWQPWVYLTFAGLNDYSPALLLLVGLIAIRSRPLLGAGTLAVAAALKPYAFAWFLPAIGYAGLRGAAVMAVTTALLWSPLFLWWGGVPAFLETVRLAAQAHPEANAVNLPILRWGAVPFVALSLLARRWDDMVILGSAAFIIYLFLDRWASGGYWIAVVPILGLALESRFHPITPGAARMARRRGDSRRAAWSAWIHGPNAPE
jgi:hypothetical protein